VEAAATPPPAAPLEQQGGGAGHGASVSNTINLTLSPPSHSTVAAMAAAPPKVHVSFSTDDALTMMQIQDAITKSGCECTVVHTAQTDGWFEEWSRKAEQAEYLIVLWLPGYKKRFSPALLMEGRKIMELHARGARLFIYDETMKPSEVRANLLDGAVVTGPKVQWMNFISSQVCRAHAEASSASYLAPLKLSSYVSKFDEEGARDPNEIADYKLAELRDIFGMTGTDARKLRKWLDELFDEDEPIEVIRPPAPERFFCGLEGCPKCDLISLKLANKNLQMNLDERLDVVMHCTEIGEKSASKAEGKDVVMVVGNTGCGKSTLVNVLHGCNMVEKKIDMGDNVVKLAWLVDNNGDNKAELMKIGHNNQSMTFIPDGA